MGKMSTIWFLLFIFGQCALFAASLYAIAFSIKKCGKDELLAFPLALIAAGIAGYFAFWIGYFSPFLLKAFKAAFWVWVAITIAIAVRAKYRPKELFVCLALMVIATVLILSLAYIGVGYEALIDRAKNGMISSDSEIPYLFAQAIKHGQIPVPLIGDWLSSDRPPLQSGFYLLFGWSIGDRHAAYQVLSVCLQMTVIPTAYWFTRRFSIQAVATASILIVVFFTHLVIIHGLHVWPKLIATSYLLIAAVTFFRLKTANSIGAFVVGASCALAMLAHGGSAFALLGFAITSVVIWQIPKPTYIFLTLATFAVLYAPWTAYQRFIDPPGDRLLKWHIAGQESPTSDSLPQAVRKAYANISMEQYLERQKEKVGVLVAFPLATPEALIIWSNENLVAAKAWYGEKKFYYSFATLGLAGTLLIFLPLLLFSKDLRPLTLTVFAACLAWMLIMLKGDGVIVHQGTFYVQVCALLLLLFWLSRWPRILAVIAIAQTVTTWLLW